MELIFIFTIILCEICLVNFFEVVKVVRTFGIDRNFAFNNRILRFAGCTLGKTEDSIF